MNILRENTSIYYYHNDVETYCRDIANYFVDIYTPGYELAYITEYMVMNYNYLILLNRRNIKLTL